MGLLSSSKKKTVNQTNYDIDDYSGADLSQQTEIDNSITGEFAGNNGNISVIDGGAFELALEANNNMAALAETGFALGESAIDTGADLAEYGIDAGIELTSQGFGFADSALTTVSDNAAYMADTTAGIFGDSLAFADNVSARGLDAALAVHSTVSDQLLLGSELTLALAEQNADQSLTMQQDNNAALNNGFKGMLQFAENFSRSDGAAVAEINMKTIGIIALGAVLSVYVLKVVK